MSQVHQCRVRVVWEEGSILVWHRYQTSCCQICHIDSYFLHRLWFAKETESCCCFIFSWSKFLWNSANKVTHPSTIPALGGLALEIPWVPSYSLGFKPPFVIYVIFTTCCKWSGTPKHSRCSQIFSCEIVSKKIKMKWKQ